MRITKRSILLAGCGFAALAMPAHAQDNAEEEDVIVVTAQNRAQDVQDVPIAMDVIGADEIADSGLNSANDLGQIAPAVQINQDQGTVKITVRGVGTNSNDEAQDTSVVANIDGEYINRPNVLGVALFDLERVEVLRGPQGTLYGRNSTGGAINFVTRKPELDAFGANGSVSYGNYNDVQVNAGVNVPLADNAAVRLAGFFADRDGYVSHPAAPARGPFPAFAGGSSDDNHAYGARASLLLLDADGRLTLNLAGEIARRSFTPQSFASADLNAAGNGPTGPGCNRAGYTRVAPNYTQTLCVPSGTTFLQNIDRTQYAAPAFGLGKLGQDTWALRGRLAYELSDNATISYTGGYRSYNGDEDNFGTLPVVYRNFTFLDEADTESHELRLNGEFDGGIIYQVGAFYFREVLDREGGFFLPIGPNGSYLSYFLRYVESSSQSVFGQAEFPLGDQFTVIAGARYTDGSRSAVYNNDGIGVTGALFNRGPSRPPRTLLNSVIVPGRALNLGSDDSKFTWTLGANYEPNPDTLIYAKVSTGFKAGGFDAVGAYAPETNTAYEVGGKFSFGDSASNIFNLTAFYYDYKDLQVSVLLDTTVGGQTFNAGAATIWGVEADFNYEIIENGVVSLSANYLNAEYDELLAQYAVFTVPGTGADITGIGDLDPTTPGVQQPNFAGNIPAFSPEWVLTAGYTQGFDLGSSGMITFNASTRYKSSYFTNFFNFNDSKQAGFFQSDLTLDWSPESEAFNIMVYVRNLENVRPLTYGGYTAAGPDDIFNFQFGTPRTYGVRASFEF